MLRLLSLLPEVEAARAEAADEAARQGVAQRHLLVLLGPVPDVASPDGLREGAGLGPALPRAVVARAGVQPAGPHGLEESLALLGGIVASTTSTVSVFSRHLFFSVAVFSRLVGFFREILPVALLGNGSGAVAAYLFSAFHSRTANAAVLRGCLGGLGCLAGGEGRRRRLRREEREARFRLFVFSC